jgi:predicted TIM-barrel fold metal-dependent hydrolase
MNEPLSRREFLKAGATASLASAGLLPAGTLAQDPPKRLPRVDTHAHCFAGKNDPRFPYHELAPYRPDTPSPPEHLLKCMADGGVDYAVLVHPEPYQDDHRYLEYCLEVGKGKLKGTLLAFAGREGSVERVPELARRLDVVALRIHAYVPERLPPLGKPEVRNLWKTIADSGMAVELQVTPRYAPAFEPLIREFSGTPVVVDHLGFPFHGTPDEHETIVKWRRFPNVFIKLSDLPSRDVYPYRDIGPIIQRFTIDWGPERMVYGGGVGGTGTGERYRRAFDRAAAYLTHLSADDQAKILGGNAYKLFRFGAAKS